MADILIKGAPYRDWEPDTILLGYQRDWVRDYSIYKFCEKSRRVGFTWASAYGDVEIVTPQGARDDVWVSSRDLTQARLYINDCRSWARKINVGAEYLGKTVLDNEQAFTLKAASGASINAMSSSPDAQAGKAGHRRLDEFALHPDPEQLFDITFPGIVWGGSIAIWSSHRGSNHFFNRLKTEIVEKGNPKGWSHHKVTIVDALEYGLLEKLRGVLPPNHPVHADSMDEADYYNFLRTGARDEEAFQQEFMCVPADDASAFLEYHWIDAAGYKQGDETHIDLKTLKERGNPLYVGVDVGRDHDFTVIYVLEELGDVLYERQRIELQAVMFSEQERQLYEVLQLPNMRRCCIDQSGLGRQFAERAAQRFGTYKVEGVTFTNPVKEELAYPLRGRFEDRLIRIADDKNLYSDLRAVKRETTAAGNPRFAADRGTNGHADRFWALALAVHARGTNGAQFTYERGGSNRPDLYGSDRGRTLNEFSGRRGGSITL